MQHPPPFLPLENELIIVEKAHLASFEETLQCFKRFMKRFATADKRNNKNKSFLRNCLQNTARTLQNTHQYNREKEAGEHMMSRNSDKVAVAQ